jgi:two-component system chemotaxis response regulator CheB
VLVSGCGDAARQLGAGLAVGAVAVVNWPSATDPDAHAHEQAALLTTLRLMSDVRVVTRRASRPARPAAGTRVLRSAPQVLAIAASTGGPAALQMLLCGLGARFPLPILIAQHIARGFEAALAEWLNTTVPLPVRVGQQGEWLLPGHAYLAPADHHLGLSVPGRLLLRPAEAGDRFCPSADLLFESIAAIYAAAAIGVILTGMGDDGTRGLLALRAAGAPTLGQSAQSCVVYGMPRAAFEAGAIGRVEPLAALAPAIAELAGGSLSAGGQHAR